MPEDSRCTSSTIKLQTERGLEDVAVARVLTKSDVNGDVIYNTYNSFVRLPNDRVVNLGEVAPVPISRNAAGNFLWMELDIDTEAAGGSCCIDHGLFYEAVLEPSPQGFCMNYRMKAPFLGSFHQCSIRDRMSGDIGYAAGALSWKDALNIACREQIGATNEKCSIKNLYIERDADGTLYYAARALFERQEYRIEVMTGAVSVKTNTY